jgi:pimeloyl-ACP methyl ester carboxylesterase
VLMDTVARPFRFLPPAVLEGARKLIESGGMAALFQLLKASPRPRPPSHARWMQAIGEEEYWARIEAKIVAMDPAAWLGLGGQDFGGVLDRLGEIRCPTTVMVGAEDVVFLEPTAEMVAAIPGAHAVTIPDAAHSPQFENRSAWLAAIRAHLERARG